MGLPLGRECELHSVQALLQRARGEPAALILDGQAGIGKTTLCRAAVSEATAAGFTTLRAAGSAAEVSLAWAVLADLLAGINSDAIAALSPLHQRALQAVTAGLDESGGDERLVATAFRAALDEQARLRPVLIVVDDAQWIDEPSKRVLGFAVRRLNGPVAVVAAYRSGQTPSADLSWVQPPDPQSLSRLTIGPLSAQALQALIDARLGHAPARSAMKRIHTLSGGNPFYALELARAIDGNPDGGLTALPPTLAELVHDHVGELDPAAAEAVVAVAAAFEPTVALIAGAVDRSPAELIDVLRPLESRGVLSFDGPRIRFAHPLIASCITGNAEPAAVREAHRRLADVVDRPEPRARHLALSTPPGDPDTLAALDTAAENAAARGTYSTAAELATLAIRFGGDDPMRRLRAAEFLFRAGSLDDAEVLIAPIVEDLPRGFLKAVGLMLLAGIRGYRDGVASAAGVLDRAIEEAGDIAMVRAQALLFRSLAAGAAGDLAACVDYARRARADAEATGMPELRSQALALWAYVRMNYGLGPDDEALRSALEIGDFDTIEPVTLRPTAVHGVICAWTGQLDEARTAMTDVMRRCAERGLEIDMLWVAVHLTMIDVRLGRYADAERTAREALERAHQIGGQIPLISAYTAVANVAAHQGRVADACAAAELAIKGATSAGLSYLVRHPLMSMAFAHVSDGQYENALRTLQPLLETFDSEHDTEIETGAYLPDAIAALAAVGRTDEAEPLVAALEVNGLRHDRPWMLAVGARGRALVRAVQGDLDGAIEDAERAMEHHERLPMPFERARTQMILGQLQRRRRRTQSAQLNLSEAAVVFAELGSPLWLARTQRELDRLATRSTGAALTASERRVAELAASGLTNKQIAAELYLSAKTVEMYLSNAYRKLGIRSRSQLGEKLRG